MFGYYDALQNPVSSHFKQNDNDKYLFGIQGIEWPYRNLIDLEEEKKQNTIYYHQ